jgi:hypothetical protein
MHHISRSQRIFDPQALHQYTSPSDDHTRKGPTFWQAGAQEINIQRCSIVDSVMVWLP